MTNVTSTRWESDTRRREYTGQFHETDFGRRRQHRVYRSCRLDTANIDQGDDASDDENPHPSWRAGKDHRQILLRKQHIDLVEAAAKVEAVRKQQHELAEAAARADALRKQQAELGKQQAELGKQQKALSGRMQLISDQVNQQMDQLVDEAVAEGIAQATSTR